MTRRKVLFSLPMFKEQTKQLPNDQRNANHENQPTSMEYMEIDSWK